jgi:hypothetical protein
MDRKNYHFTDFFQSGEAERTVRAPVPLASPGLFRGLKPEARSEGSSDAGPPSLAPQVSMPYVAPKSPANNPA